MPADRPPHFAFGANAHLKERFRKTAFKGFHPEEQVELLLTLCSPCKEVFHLARRLLHRFGNLRGILDAEPQELLQIHGISTHTITILQLLRESALLYLEQEITNGPLLNSTVKLESYFKARLAGLRREVFEVGLFNNAYLLMEGYIERMEEGSLDFVTVYPRKIVRFALDANAKGVVIAHNHPNGNPQPSAQDILLTQKIQQALETVEVNLVDHLIITAGEGYSFRREGLL